VLRHLLFLLSGRAASDAIQSEDSLQTPSVTAEWSATDRRKWPESPAEATAAPSAGVLEPVDRTLDAIKQ